MSDPVPLTVAPGSPSSLADTPPAVPSHLEPDRVERFLAETYLGEARVEAALNRPHVVPVYCFGRTGEGASITQARCAEGQP